jgi:UDP-glucuronate 4-epimerase
MDKRARSSGRIDIRDTKKVERVLRKTKPDLVIHLAAMVGVRPSMDHPKLYETVNVKGTQNLLEACHKAGVRKFIFASSSSVYGNDSHAPFKESDADLQPISPYAVTKKAGEALCHAYSQLYKMDICVLRFFTVYGPRQRPDLAIYKFTKLLYDNRQIPFYGDGSTERDYTYIDDIVGGVLKAAQWTMKGAPSGRFDIFNLGGSRTISLKSLVQNLERLTGRKAKLKMMPEQPGDVRRTYADISKAEKVLGYAPRTGLEKGLKKFVEWYKREVHTK